MCVCVCVCVCLSGCEDELGRMQNVRNQRLRLLQRIDRHTYDAVCWLEKNQDMFKKHVFEPILLNVSNSMQHSVYVCTVEPL